jgi:hypothetical protein
LTDEEWALLKEWRKKNQPLVYKRRETRGDGKFFWGYQQARCGGEKWIGAGTLKKLDSANKSEKTKAYRRNWQRNRYRNDPDYRQVIKKTRRDWGKKNKEKANASKRKWWRKRYKSDPFFRRKSIKKCISRRKKLGYYCERDALRRVGEITGSKILIKRIYRITADIKKKSGISMEVDHIIPVLHGGQHHERNLQMLEERINREKADNPFWMSPDGLSLDWRDVPCFLWPEKLRPEYERLIALHPKTVYPNTRLHRA